MEYDDPSLTQSFPFPKIYQFPPFFTHQVNERTWHSQLVNWNSLILAYCRYYRIYTLDLSRTSDSLKIQPSTAADTPTTNSLPADSSTSTATSDSKNKPRGEIDGELFWNRKINRALQTETIQAIFQYMVVHGNAAWLDQPNTSNTNKGSYDDFDDLEYEQQFDRFEQIFNNFPLLSSGANSNNTNNKTCILLYWRQPQEWASLISDWVDNTGQNGSVLTLYELVEGETHGSQEFKGLHPAILRAAIDILVQRGKAVIMKGPDGRVAGVKML